MKSPLINLFREQLENEAKGLAAEEGLQKRGDFLIWWYFKRLLGLSSTDVQDVVCDGAADLGIDAIWIDQNAVVHFFTFKNPVDVNAPFQAGEVDKTLSGLSAILARRHEKIANPDLKERIDEIYQTVPTGYRLHIVTSGSGLPVEAEVKLQTFVERLGGPSPDFFRWELEDIKKLQDAFYRKNLPAVEEPIDFVIDFPPYQVRAANHDCYLFHAQGTTLAALYEKHGEQLLQQNIRVYQGDNSTNALIRDTASGRQSANFLHFNNGVTFLCESAQWDGFTRRLTLRKAQVVNGGQTVRVIYAVHTGNRLKPDVAVAVRVITSQGDKEFASEVAVNLNNQNRIEPSFLRSNEPRIVQLANALASMGWYLERRESEVESLTTEERAALETRLGASLDKRMIRLKEGAQAYVATYLRQPELAKKNLKRIFLGGIDGGFFERVFNDQLTAEKFVLSYQLATEVTDYVRQFMSRKRKRDRAEQGSTEWQFEYAALLGADLVRDHSDVLDQVVPQSAFFLMASAFELRVVLQGEAVRELVNELGTHNHALLNEIILQLITFAKEEPGPIKSWPNLLKSQVFFEKFALFMRVRLGLPEPSARLSEVGQLTFL